MSDLVTDNSVGLVTFFGGGVASALIRPVNGTTWQRGVFVPGVGIDIDNDEVRLSLKPFVRGKLRMKGTLLFKDDGETHDVVAFEAKTPSGRKCLGLNYDGPMPEAIDSPF